MRYLHTIMIISLLTLLMIGCESKPEKRLDGAALLEQKCAPCHNLDMPPKTFEDEKAPPMMAVAFHIKDFLKVSTPSEKEPKFIAFFQEFVLHPSLEKSFCDKKSLQDYGLMPSQEGKVSVAEIGAIAGYVYAYYDQEKFLKKMTEKAKFEALPLGEQLAKRKGCFTCHDKEKVKSGPSFLEMAKLSKEEIFQVIKEGSQGKYKAFNALMMPPYKKSLSDSQIETIAEWIKVSKERVK